MRLATLLQMSFAASAIACGSLPRLAYADNNDCDVTVTLLGVAPVGSGVQVTFQVANAKCERSVGRFDFIYETSTRPGIAVDQTSMSWNGQEGKSFKWTETIGVGAGVTVSNVKVRPETIQSTKI